ncbi:MAG: hypothetical protein OEW64_13685 [Gammaproteobacteria bacterium]|nr:hypothetical protein [Gammaproteobacteria bacterium]MDH5305132.1 hypothetical protein [Gammaproteobacteria bacterium]MDH5322154.1 hypothetical protein [Gammaproteobacteria bacterium]
MKRQHPRSRFPDWSNPPKPRWRAALLALAAPATRVHQYRNLRSAALYDAMCDRDCKDPT